MKSLVNKAELVPKSLITKAGAGSHLVEITGGNMRYSLVSVLIDMCVVGGMKSLS